MESPRNKKSRERTSSDGGRAQASVDATVLTVTEAARSFSDVVNRAYYRGERFLLTKGGRTVAEVAPVRERPPVTASALRRALESLPHLGCEEADAFAADLDEARRVVGPPGAGPWESS